jgi:hypothetical protein
MIPDYPIVGEPARAAWGRAVVDELRANTLRSSASIRVNRAPGGTTLEIPGARGGNIPWDEPRMFAIEGGENAGEVIIRAGRLLTRRPGHEILGIMQADNGPSVDPEDVKTLSGLTAADTTYYIEIQLNATEDQVIAITPVPTTYPPANPEGRIFCLGTVTTDDAGKIVEILNWWRGGIINERRFDLDGQSLDYNSADHQGEIHLYNAGNPTTRAFNADDCFPFADIGGGDVAWTTAANLASWITGGLSIPPVPAPDYRSINLNDNGEYQWFDFKTAATQAAGLIGSGDLFGFKRSTTAGGLTAGYLYYISYANLVTDIRTSLGDGWKLGNTVPADAHGAVIGNNAATPLTVIHLANQQLVNGIWSVTATTDITPGTAATGAFQIAGGLSVAKQIQAAGFHFVDDASNNHWAAGSCHIQTLNDVFLQTINYDISLNSGRDVKLLPVGDLYINTVVGLTRTADANLLGDDGVTLIPVKIRKGIVTAT